MATVAQIRTSLESLGIIPLSSYTKLQLLHALQLACVEEIDAARKEDVRLISAKVAQTDNGDLKLLAEAMRHVVLKEQPTTPKLGYEIASIDAKQNQIPKNDEELKLLGRVLGYLNVSSYVFGNTHYDECSNGFYFRRS